MKCEICHKANAQAAIETAEGKELYVCKKCAAAEHKKEKARSRREEGFDDPEVSAEVFGPIDMPPEVVDRLFDDINGLIGKMARHGIGNDGEHPRRIKCDRPKGREYSMRGIDSHLLYRGRLHLEGISLLGELESVMRAVKATDIELVPMRADGIKDVAHAFSVRYTCKVANAAKMVNELVEQETAARKLLIGRMRIVLEDSVCRSLAVLKSCRLLTQAELLDLMSSICLAEHEGMIAGINGISLKSLIDSVDLALTNDIYPPEKRDELDAKLATYANGVFAAVRFRNKK